MKIPQERPVYRLVAVGKTGAGKSSVLNSLIGRRIFNESSSILSETKTLQRHTFLLGEGKNGISIECVDTPGCFDSSGSDLMVVEEIFGFTSQCKDGLNLILFCMPIHESRFDSSMQLALKSIGLAFGGEAYNHIIIVATMCNKVTKVEKEKGLKRIADEIIPFIKNEMHYSIRDEVIAYEYGKSLTGLEIIKDLILKISRFQVKSYNSPDIKQLLSMTTETFKQKQKEEIEEMENKIKQEQMRMKEIAESPTNLIADIKNGKRKPYYTYSNNGFDISMVGGLELAVTAIYVKNNNNDIVGYFDHNLKKNVNCNYENQSSNYCYELDPYEEKCFKIIKIDPTQAWSYDSAPFSFVRELYNPDYIPSYNHCQELTVSGVSSSKIYFSRTDDKAGHRHLEFLNNNPYVHLQFRYYLNGANNCGLTDSGYRTTSTSSSYSSTVYPGSRCKLRTAPGNRHATWSYSSSRWELNFYVSKILTEAEVNAAGGSWKKTSENTQGVAIYRSWIANYCFIQFWNTTRNVYDIEATFDKLKNMEICNCSYEWDKVKFRLYKEQIIALKEKDDNTSSSYQFSWITRNTNYTFQIFIESCINPVSCSYTLSFSPFILVLGLYIYIYISLLPSVVLYNLFFFLF
eukprot:TRINITY_DN470_c2_g1_i2.p1 TRINITY_DN470_c2_g1~~TRINITY_DN470_c2_g1_i2.p1  ORF type:complete len:631 (+),score=34.24 TRINITY_DN470_c2_g1_i2:1019-2911(+)